MGKYNVKRKRTELEIVPRPEDSEPIPLPAVRTSDEPIPKKTKWINKQRVLVLAARGINSRDRHLMNDLKTLMPHGKTDSKLERTKTLSVINDLCVMKHCNKAMLFEGRRKRDLYMWLANSPEGPTAKFLVENIHTMGELKLTGNCLKGSRPLLSFSNSFKEKPYLLLLKEVLTQTFGVPNYHPKSQPFVDHIYTFTFLDDRIWFRNFQILSEDGALVEVGPRFVMNPIKIFRGSFDNEAIWENPEYVSPAKHRQMLKKSSMDRYRSTLEQKAKYEATKEKVTYDLNEYDKIFEGDSTERAQEFLVKDDLNEKKRVLLEEKEKKEEMKLKRATQRKLEQLMKRQKPKKKVRAIAVDE